jgi:hypothetical protein
MSNLSHDAVNHGRGPDDIAQKTIEQPTDVEDADNGLPDDPSEFDHLNNSPDIKLKSIEIDDGFSARQHTN